MALASTAPVGGIRDEVAALKRERTIAVAAELFDERGCENTTLDAIAGQMNVTKPFIYARSASKGELLAEMCSHGIASALRASGGVLNTVQGSPSARLAEVARRFVTAMLDGASGIAAVPCAAAAIAAGLCSHEAGVPLPVFTAAREG